VRVKKNKVAPPFIAAEFDMDNQGISLTGDIVDLGVQYKIIDKSGSFFKYKNEVIAQGREATKKALEENPQLKEELRSLVWKKAKNIGPQEPTPGEEE
jgi:recombination protein RecA